MFWLWIQLISSKTHYYILCPLMSSVAVGVRGDKTETALGQREREEMGLLSSRNNSRNQLEERKNNLAENTDQEFLSSIGSIFSPSSAKIGDGENFYSILVTCGHSQKKGTFLFLTRSDSLLVFTRHLSLSLVRQHVYWQVAINMSNGSIH